MSRSAIYLDHNASAPLLPEARDAYVGALDLIGNPSSVHAHGRALRELIEAGRDRVARRAGAERHQVVFTGSATEAITQAIAGGVKPLGVDALRTLPLTPMDGFVLSRVDGSSSEHEIALATGLPEDDVHASIDKLAKLGVVAVPVEANVALAQPPPPAFSEPPFSGRDDASSLGASSMPPVSIETFPDEEGIELEAETRKLVNDLYAKLDGSTHYELLDIPQEADKKRVKRAYYELAAHIHPDKFFRKQLGAYKPKMEAIFARVTLAHDVLTSKDRRPEYDTYLGARSAARKIESMSDLKAVRVSQAPHSTPVAGPSVSQPVPAPAPRLVEDRERRELLAKRLGMASKRPGVVSSRPPQKESIPPERSADPDALKRLFEERLTAARTSQAKKHVEAGHEAMSRGDVVAAATSFKTALSFVPDDPEATRLLADVNEKAMTVLADAYRKQAVYEEKNGQWVEAARSWTRVAKLLPNDLDVQDSAAKAIVQASGDLHEAATFGQRAANGAPDVSRYRKTLGSVYLAAGLKKNARRELEAALRISPDDDTIQDLLKRAT